MIEFDNVTKVYNDDTVAIEDVSFTVEEGTTTVLVGPSGCGKTTTMKLVNRLEDPTEGTVYFDGTDVLSQDRVELRRDIGYVIQEIGLFDHMTVGENVATVPELKGWEQDRIETRVDELLDLMDLPADQYRDQYPSSLSGGQRQRVGVARALAADPDVLLMDEPFGALDPITRSSLQDEFLEIQEQINTTILFVTHSVDEALKMGDRIAIFDVGELVRYDTPEKILENPGSEFVADFIGEDRALKQLQVTTVRSVMRDEIPTRFTGGSNASDGLVNTNDSLVPVEPSDSAQTALSRIIQAGTDVIPVVKNGDVIGVVSESDIRDHTQMTAQNTEAV
ncbi:osmoprotectant transport system ATP-binding protein [Halorubrum ezzemoulense]|uniref:Molybdate/tungstate import ATP-binding protein WtpC n=1 Tax=Halorubrum ezzemoulense TaxID=337243 RepID=A0A238YPG6_HALEZ|nr:ABC transporter ATP-binding protein [Halorubrum ezzemoulense]SNR72591.1 osmoprotectant transport system ATP-binding protein [Halorubrum ezzemoulense]